MGLAAAPQLLGYWLRHHRHRALSQKYEFPSALLQWWSTVHLTQDGVVWDGQEVAFLAFENCWLTFPGKSTLPVRA